MFDFAVPVKLLSALLVICRITVAEMLRPGSAAGDASAGSLKDPAVFVAGLRLGGVINLVVGFAWMIALLVWFMNCLIDICHEIMRETGAWWEGGRPVWVSLVTTAAGLFAAFIALVVIIQLWG